MSEKLDIFNDVFDYLIQKTGVDQDRESKFFRNLVYNRIDEGYVYEDFKAVIDKKWNDWHNTQFKVYLRPDTLFGYNFKKYLHEQRNPNNVQKLFNAVQKAKSSFGRLDKER
jgi:uncharacterized phage protein (TIGR02220 family)